MQREEKSEREGKSVRERETERKIQRERDRERVTVRERKRVTARDGLFQTVSLSRNGNSRDEVTSVRHNTKQNTNNSL